MLCAGVLSTSSGSSLSSGNRPPSAFRLLITKSTRKTSATPWIRYLVMAVGAGTWQLRRSEHSHHSQSRHVENDQCRSTCISCAASNKDTASDVVFASSIVCVRVCTETSGSAEEPALPKSKANEANAMCGAAWRRLVFVLRRSPQPRGQSFLSPCRERCVIEPYCKIGESPRETHGHERLLTLELDVVVDQLSVSTKTRISLLCEVLPSSAVR